MSIVPLNLGAAAPFRLNPHFLQVVAASSFSVPQFGQNTQHLLDDAGEVAAYTSSPPILKGVGAVVALSARSHCFCSALDTPLSGSLRFASPGGTPGKTSTSTTPLALPQGGRSRPAPLGNSWHSPSARKQSRSSTKSCRATPIKWRRASRF